MDHVRDIELIELAAGRVPGERREAVEAHLAVCAECKARWEGIAGTWGALGVWDVAPLGIDLAPAVEGAARREAERQTAAGFWRRHAPMVARLAAAVVLGAGTGHVAARLARPAADQAAEVAADGEAVARSLRLHALEEAAPAGVADAVLGVRAPVDEEAL